MRRLWKFLLLAPAVALVLPTAAAAAPAAPAGKTAPMAKTVHTQQNAPERFLAFGARGASVRSLQQRLAALKYYPGSIDGQFSTSTQEAVWAFQEVQGLPGASYVNTAMWRALAHPRAPRVLVPRGGSMRIEINLRNETLVLYRDNQVKLISHVSTGGGYYYCSPGGGCGTAITPTGDYHTLSFLPGWVAVPLGYMYNPVFFIGTAFAIHGDVPVPLQPVSHGCVRIPMDIAAFFHTQIRVPGTPVYIRR
jgi:hypothetical protein